MTVGAESERKTWYLPKKVLTHCSPFFDAALNGNFAEASAKAVDLPEDDPKAFEVWATWLSLGKCRLPFDNGGFDLTPVRAWNLGEKFACPAFKDHVMSQLLDWFDADENLSLGAIEAVYVISPPGSKIRRFFVDWFVWYKRNANLDADEVIVFLREVPEFSDDVVRREVNWGSIMKKHQHYGQYYENPAFKPDAWDSE